MLYAIVQNCDLKSIDWAGVCATLGVKRKRTIQERWRVFKIKEGWVRSPVKKEKGALEDEDEDEEELEKTKKRSIAGKVGVGLLSKKSKGKQVKEEWSDGEEDALDRVMYDSKEV